MNLREACGEERWERFPPKIKRAVLLYLHGFPVTEYLIVSTETIEYAVHEIRVAIEKSRYGIVVRAVPQEDGAKTMSLPYLWLKKPEEASVETLPRTRFLMAFAPQATPETAKAVVVGRYATVFDEDRKVIEYYQDEIRPRVLDRVQRGDPRFGSLIRDRGRFFRVESMGCASVNIQLVRILERYDEMISVLARRLRAGEVCLEFTWNRGRIEFHDFDYWRRA